MTAAGLLCRTLAEMAAATSVHVVAVIEPIIQHADWFFPGGEYSRGQLGGSEAAQDIPQDPPWLRS